MTDAPAVSIAIRAFRRQWLGEAIESVLVQTHRDLELVVYDGSGELAELVSGYASDPRLRYIRGKRHAGPGGRFRAAVALCRGEYLGMLDDDDRYAPEFVAHLLAALNQIPDAGIAFCRASPAITDRSARAADPMPAGRVAGMAERLLECRLSIQTSRMLIRRAALAAAERRQPMPEDVAPDLWLNLRTALDGWVHGHVDEPLLFQRCHAGQLSRRDGGDIPVATFRQIAVDDPDLDRLRRASLARHLVRRALFRLGGDRRADALADLDHARKADESVLKTLRRVLAVAASTPLAGPAVAQAGLVILKLRRHLGFARTQREAS